MPSPRRVAPAKPSVKRGKAAKRASHEGPKAPTRAPNDSAAPTVALRPIDSLIPYARNARTHSAEQVAQLAASIVEFGWTNPVLADAQGIVAGHGRLLAARQLLDAGTAIKFPNGQALPPGLVPVLDCTGWNEAKRRAYILADNNLAINAGWDVDLLAVELQALKDENFDLRSLGFSAQDLAAMMTPADDVDVTPKLDRKFTYGVAIACADETQQAELIARFEGEGFTCKPLISL